MSSETVSQLMMDPGCEESLTAHLSNKNPFSERAFRTLKYRPTFPERFRCIEEARAYFEEFFNYYNLVHRHSGVGLHTPS